MIHKMSLVVIASTAICLSGRSAIRLPAHEFIQVKPMCMKHAISVYSEHEWPFHANSHAPVSASPMVVISLSTSAPCLCYTKVRVQLCASSRPLSRCLYWCRPPATCNISQRTLCDQMGLALQCRARLANLPENTCASRTLLVAQESCWAVVAELLPKTASSERDGKTATPGSDAPARTLL